MSDIVEKADKKPEKKEPEKILKQDVIPVVTGYKEIEIKFKL